MNLDDWMLPCLCVIDGMMPMIITDHRLQARGPAPKLSDSEVMRMEGVGRYLGLSQDQEVFDSFRRHDTHFFPSLDGLHRSPFVRQAANRWALKERVWCRLRDEVSSYEPSLSRGERVPLPVYRLARAPWSVRFRSQASYGKDQAEGQTLYGFEVHAQLSWPGLFTRVFLVPANEADGEIAPRLLEGTTGVVLGERTSRLADQQAVLRTKGMFLQAPFGQAHWSKAAADQRPVLGCVRSLIDLVFAPLTERCQMKGVWARDVWHLRNRLVRCILMPTLCFLFNQQDEAPYLPFDRLVA
ncbi:MAG: hypothetical protein NVSMB33_05520 [Ktedonobacteraceae bacterium]